MHSRHTWTEAEIQTLRARYPYEVAQAVAAALGMRLAAIYNKAFLLGIKKAPEFYLTVESARIRAGKQSPAMIATRFQPGLTPWNKGTKGLQYEGSKPTQFKPGQRPHTWLPVGTYRITTDGCMEKKVADVPGPSRLRWQPVAHFSSPTVVAV